MHLVNYKTKDFYHFVVVNVYTIKKMCAVWPWLNDNGMNFGIFCKRLTISKICLCTMINSSSLLLLNIVQGGV